MMIELRVRFCAALLLLRAALPLAAQDSAPTPADAGQPSTSTAFALGGTSISILEYQLVSPVVPAGRSTLMPKLMLRSSGLEMALAASATVDSVEGIELDLEELLARFRLGDSGVLSLGRFTYLPGTALLFSNVEYFSSMDVSGVLSRGQAPAGSPDDMAQIRLFGDSWHLTVTAAPFRPSEEQFPTDSAWFPRRDIRKSFDVLSMTYALRNLAWIPTDAPAAPVQDPGLSVEGGVFVGALDLSLSWFDGPDRVPAVTAYITMPVTPWGVYDVTLEQQHSRIRREGAAASLQVGGWKAWVDTSLFQGKQLASGDLYSAVDGWRTGTRSLDGLDLTSGISWNPPWASSMLAVEWKDAWYFGDTTGLTFPILHRAVAAIATASFIEDKVNLSLTGLLSLSDFSSVLIAGASVDLGGETTLTIACPYFFGDLPTELGQFRTVGRGILGLSVGF